jgi:hypothetical protein
MENGPGFGVADGFGAADGEGETAGRDGEGSALPLGSATTAAAGEVAGPLFATRLSSANPVANSVPAARATTIVAAASDPTRRAMERLWRR